MAGRLYRMAKVVSANPASWGIVDANQISGFRTVAKLTDLYSIAACILSSAYGDGTTTGADAVGQIWHVQENGGKDYRLKSWANRGTSEGWEEVLYADSVYSKSEIDGKINTIYTNISSKADKTTVTELSGTVDTIGGTVANHTASIGMINNTLKSKADSSTVTKLTATVGSIATDLTDFKALKGAKDGLAPLDANGNVPLKNLGNLDTTLFEVVSELPSTIATIKKHIYLKAAGTTGDKNNYAEYIYTGDPTATYDATKWEKLGEVTASVDLSGYYTKDQIDTKVNAINDSALISAGISVSSSSSDIFINSSTVTNQTNDVVIPIVTTTDAEYVKGHNGLMSPAMLTKLNGLTNYAHPTHTAHTSGLYKITVDGLGHISAATPVKTTDLADLGALTSVPTFRLGQSGGDDYINIEATYNEKTYSTSLGTAGADHPGLMSAAAYTKLENTSNNLSTLTTKVNGIKSFNVNDVVAGEQYSLMATDGTDAFNVGNIFIRTAGNGNTEIEAGGKKTDINAIAAYARYDINGNHIDTTYWKKADLVAISNDELTSILV